jgi:hypothetical protein
MDSDGTLPPCSRRLRNGEQRLQILFLYNMNLTIEVVLQSTCLLCCLAGLTHGGK